jgi:hypothetical protein
MYSRDENGNQRLLIPTGYNTYDSLVSIHLKELGTETEQEILELARQVPKTGIEERAPHQIENEFYIFTVDKFKTHFRRGYQKFLNYNHYRYFWFFSMKRGKDQVMYRIRIMLARLWNARANGIEKSCKRKHFEPYGYLAAIMKAFRAAAKSLQNYSEKFIVYADKAQPKPEQKTETLSEANIKVAGAVLDLLSNYLPKIYEPMRTLLSVDYPDLCKPPPHS